MSIITNMWANPLKGGDAKLRSLEIESDCRSLLIWQSGRIKYVLSVFCAVFYFTNFFEEAYRMITLTSLFICMGLALSAAGMSALTIIRKKHQKKFN